MQLLLQGAYLHFFPDLRAHIDGDVASDVRTVSELQYLRLSERLMIRAERLPELDAWLRAHGG